MAFKKTGEKKTTWIQEYIRALGRRQNRTVSWVVVDIWVYDYMTYGMENTPVAVTDVPSKEIQLFLNKVFF